jgi:hypothetical protein
MTYRVEVTAATINELSGKLAALASQLKGLPATFDVLRVEASEINLPAPAPSAPEPAVEPDPVPEAKEPPAEAEPARAYDYNTEVAPRVLEMVSKCGRDAVKELLAKYNVTRASQLDPSHFPSLMDAVNAAMES